MSGNQSEGSANDAKTKVKAASGKVAGDKGTQNKGKADKDRGKSGSVLAELNDEPGKTAK
jgi:uncharacterized protein YjbJ (UPF0337 family)